MMTNKIASSKEHILKNLEILRDFEFMFFLANYVDFKKENNQFIRRTKNKKVSFTKFP